MEETDKIMEAIDKYYQKKEKKFIPGKTRIQFGGDVSGAPEVKNVVSSLLSGWLARGKFTEEFEKKFSEIVGSKDAVLVNSGSSALIVAFKTLKNRNIPNFLKDGDEIITSSLTHVSTVNAILHNNLTPVLIDADWTYNINPDLIEQAITSRTRGILVMHFLGNPCKMDKIMEIAKKNNLFVIEDACDSYCAEFNGQKVGTFGNIGTASFYVAHLITLGEGGAVFYNDTMYEPIIKSLVNWGRACPCSICKMQDNPDYKCPNRFDSENKGDLKDYDSRYIFTNVGYNFRVPDMQAAFGLEQLKRIKNFIEIRNKNFELYKNGLKKFKYLKFPEVYEKSNPVWFTLPLTITENAPFTRKQLVEWLESKRIETRPFFAGLINKQPGYKDVNLKIAGEIPVTTYTKDNSFFIGCYPGISEEMINYVINSFEEFFSKYEIQNL